jgi:hypothetical protein
VLFRSLGILIDSAHAQQKRRREYELDELNGSKLYFDSME